MTTSPQKKILIVGGSGFIGTKLTELLLERGYSVTVVDLIPPRLVHESLSFVKKNIAAEPAEPALVDGFYGVVNLAGATIGRRWSDEYKKILYTSRIDTTRSLVHALKSAEKKPAVLINASAIGYYGDTGAELLTENHASGTDFLAKLCVDWEAEAIKANECGVRVVLIRTAHVLGKGGLLETLLPLFKKGLGGYFGSGRQYMPWVHWSDVVGIYLFALENNLEGAYNVGAGTTISQAAVFRSFAKIIHAPVVWRIPKFAARLALGEFAGSLVSGQNTSSEKIKSAGYAYQYENINDALKNTFL